MRVYLDDVRPVPDGWVLARTVDEALAWLATGQVTEVSLDHDLGEAEAGTGYDVLLWIEQAVAERDYVPPAIRIHTSNPAARPRMQAAVRSIQRLHRRS